MGLDVTNPVKEGCEIEEAWRWCSQDQILDRHDSEAKGCIPQPYPVSGHGFTSSLPTNQVEHNVFSNSCESSVEWDQQPENRQATDRPCLIAQLPRTGYGLDGHDHSDNENIHSSRFKKSKVGIGHAHRCAKCGRPRSRRFRSENPLSKTGVAPVPGICKRCTAPRPSRASPRKSSSRTKNETQVKEILVRRRRPRTYSPVRIFQPVPYMQPSSPRYHRSKPRSISPDRTRNQLEPELRCTLANPSRCLGNNVTKNTLKTARNNDVGISREDEKKKLNRPRSNAAPRYQRRNVHDLIASHPSPWRYGYMITLAEPQRPTTGESDVDLPHREWYFRQKRCYVVPKQHG